MKRKRVKCHNEYTIELVNIVTMSFSFTQVPTVDIHYRPNKKPFKAKGSNLLLVLSFLTGVPFGD